MKIKRFTQKLFSGFDDYYRKNRNQIQEQNYNDLVNGNQDENIKKKALSLYKDNYNIQQNFTEDGFIEAALNGCHNKEIFAILMFIKNDKKQNSAEECQAQFIKDNFKGLFSSINLLNKSGGKSLYIKDGKITKTKGSVKSLDLEMIYKFGGKELKFYGTLKHIDGQGGAQDNQYNDLLSTNAEFIKLNDPNIITFTDVSGSYFKPGKLTTLELILKILISAL